MMEDPYTSDDEVILLRPMIKCKNKHCCYRIHPNPPRFFTNKDKKYCCSLCRISNGHNHGGHCKCEPFIQ